MNPTSNLLIAGLPHPLAQSMFVLHPFQVRTADDPLHGIGALPVTIHADDPLQFATTLADEFAYAWAGIVVDFGVDPGIARLWLEAAAEASWRWRFTLPGQSCEPRARPA